MRNRLKEKKWNPRVGVLLVDVTQMRRKQTCCVSAVLILSRVRILPSQENHSQHTSPLCQFSKLLSRHPTLKPSYNSVEGLLAPAREGALRPLSGRYLLKLAAGQRSLMWSPLVFGIDTISILDTSSFPLFVVGSSVSCPPFRPESAVTSQIRRRETSAAARPAGRGIFSPSGRR